MEHLTATFTVQLSAPIIFRGPGAPREYGRRVDGFATLLTLTPDPGRRSKSKGDRYWTYLCEEPRVSVSRPETMVPPTRKASPREHSAYFAERIPAYRQVAVRVLNNAVAFLKYKLRQPLLKFVDEHHQSLQNPVWTDETRTDVGHGATVFVVPRIHGLRGEMGCKHLTTRHGDALSSALERTPAIELHDELLADAQAAAFDGNIRRAVLELAVACEVFVKSWLFTPRERAGQVFEALENKRLVEVRVLELLDVGGAAIRGKRFRDFDSAAYKDIDHLFRARNRVAHRGEAHFLDDAGRRHVVDQKMLSKWWTSIEKLIAWAR